MIRRSVLSFYSLISRAIVIVAALATAIIPAERALAQPALTSTDIAEKIKCGNSGKIVATGIGLIVGVAAVSMARVKGAGKILIPLMAGGFGLLVGSEIDNRKCRLKKLAKLSHFDITIDRIPTVLPQDGMPDENSKSDGSAAGLSVSIRDDSRQFSSGSDVILPSALPYFSAIADMYSYGSQRSALGDHPSDDKVKMVETLQTKAIIIVGHTDDTGSSHMNADLSERRALAVAKLFAERGVPAANIYYQGAGEALPIADNNTEEGRSKNRRVEIVDVPTVGVLQSYLDSRIADASRHRRLTTTEAEAALVEVRPATSSTTPQRRPRPKKVRNGKASTPTAPESAAASIRPINPPPNLNAAARTNEINFGGVPAGFLVPDIGELLSATRVASGSMSTCDTDRPHISYAVKSLSGASPSYDTAQYFPGLYDSSWAGMVNGQLVGLTHVAVLRDNGMPVAPPQLLIYRDWKPSARKPAPSVKLTSEVNVYRGKNGMLYRVFPGPGANLRCIDVILPSNGGGSAPFSQLYYRYAGESRRAGFNLQIAR